jgi:PAS domain-containing protein
MRKIMPLFAEAYHEFSDEQIHSPSLKRLRSIWQTCARGGLPQLADMMQHGLGDLDDRYSLKVPEGSGHFIYTHYGHTLARFSRQNLLGLTTRRLPADIRNFLVREYNKVILTGQPVFLISSGYEDSLDIWERLIVPARMEGGLTVLVGMGEPRNMRDTLSDTILEASPDAIIAIQAIQDDFGTVYDGRIIALNESACRAMGKTRGQLIHQPLLANFPQLHDNGIWDLCLDVLASRTAVRFDIDARPLSVGLQRMTLFPMAGGLAIMMQDISDLSGETVPLIGCRPSNILRFAAAAA